MEFLRRQLDDPEAAPCGRCDNCTGRRWAADVGEAARDQAGDRLRRPGIEIEPRKMWPAAMPALGIEVKGRIPPELSALPGRALALATAPGWGLRVRDLLDPSRPDGAVPDDVFDAVVRVLATWGWERRPVGIVTVASSARGQLIDSLAARLGQVGRLPVLGRVEYAPRDGAAGGSENSAQRLLALWDRFRLPAPLAASLPSLEGPVLLVDDRVDSGWTMTVVARMLREAGAPSVLPLALSSAG
jgi:ATP-dependent DNA helicase RecQ